MWKKPKFQNNAAQRTHEKRKAYPLNELKLPGMVASLNEYPKKRLVHEERNNYQSWSYLK